LPSFEVVKKGFNREQVRMHLLLVGERMSDLETRLDRTTRDLRHAELELERSRDECEQERRRVDELQSMIDSLSPGDRDPYAGVSQQVMDLLHEFDRGVELLRTKADIESRRIIAEARTEAANRRIEALGSVKEARAQAERLLQQARDDAADIRAQLRPLRELTMSQAEAFRDRLKTSLLELEALMAVRSADEPVIVLGEPVDEAADEAPNEAPPPGDGGFDTRHSF
jgi:cell division septum initiation protein DivIVA